MSSMIGALAAIERPELFESIVMIGPSPSYINDGEYVGGFERADIEDLLEMLDNNHLGWSAMMAPIIMGTPDHPEFAAELEASFCIALSRASASKKAMSNLDAGRLLPLTPSLLNAFARPLS